jgi:hypothetical protein
MFDSVHQSGADKMLKSAHKLLCEADAVITYNGKSFDIPTLKAEFLLSGMAPPAPSKQIDLYRVVRAEFRFPSKKLDYIAKRLGHAGKVKHRGMDLWKGCMAGDEKCWTEMERYNRRDVTELEKVYEDVRPWIRLHPNHGLYDGGEVCPNCGGGDLQRRGFARTAVSIYPRMQCKSCGAWAKGAPRAAPQVLRHAA